MILALILLPIWFGCGLLAAGDAYAYMQSKYPDIADETRAADRALSAFLFVVGPCGLFATLIHCRFQYGWRCPFGGGK